MNKKFKIIIVLGVIAIILFGGYKSMKKKPDIHTTNGGLSTIYRSMTGTVKMLDLKANEIVVSIEDKLDEYKYDELTLIYPYSNLQKISLEENVQVEFYFFSNEPKDQKKINIGKIEVIK